MKSKYSLKELENMYLEFDWSNYLKDDYDYIKSFMPKSSKLLLVVRN